MNIVENKNFRKFIYIIPVIFVFELILGFSGKTIVVAGIPIRYILFFLSLICLYGYMVLNFVESKITLLSIKNFKDSYIGQFKILDWAVLVFILSGMFSAVIVPLILGGNIRFALDDAKSLIFLTLYFPVSFLIKKKQLNHERLRKYIYIACSALSGIYVVFFIGLKQNIKFLNYFFETLNKLLFNLGEVPRIILGHNETPRVIFTTCTFLIVGIYLFFVKERKSVFDYCILFINITALMTTLTKSIWFGVIIGGSVLSAYMIVNYIMQKRYKSILRLISTLACVVAFCVIMNYTVFDNMVLSRFAVSFAISGNDSSNSISDNSEHEDSGKNGDIIDNDLDAATISNDIKVEQTEKLMAMWEGSPLIGHGYGSYAEDCIRSEAFPYSYEMQLPALLMKIGIVGVMAWVFFGIAMAVTAWKSTKNNRRRLFCWAYLLIAFALAVQTNPMLLSFTGMAIVLFIAMESTDFV